MNQGFITFFSSEDPPRPPPPPPPPPPSKVYSVIAVAGRGVGDSNGRNARIRTELKRLESSGALEQAGVKYVEFDTNAALLDTLARLARQFGSFSGLEIVTHGNPMGMNGFTLTPITFGRRIKDQNVLLPTASIWLNSCNVAFGPVPQLMADASNRTVYAAEGYISGYQLISNGDGFVNISRTGDSASDPIFTGSKDAEGKASVVMKPFIPRP